MTAGCVHHELFAHARNDEDHRELLDEHYAAITDGIVEVVERGIEAGVFHDVDAERTGRFITDAIHVGRERRILLGHEGVPEEVRQTIEEFVLDSLYVDG